MAAMGPEPDKIEGIPNYEGAVESAVKVDRLISQAQELSDRLSATVDKLNAMLERTNEPAD
jgi:hypothetical protein